MSYCWSEPTGPDEVAGLCVDGVVSRPSELPLLTAPPAATLSVGFSTSASPTEVLLTATSADGSEHRLEAAAANPTQFSADLAPGVYVASLVTVWDPGDAIYYFRLQVEAPGPTSTTSLVDDVSSGEQRQLPATGGDLGMPAGAGAAMVAIGTALLLARRRVAEP